MFVQSDFPNNPEFKSDRHLWIEFKEGNRNALSALFIRYYEKLFRYGMGLYPFEETVKDSIQKLYLRLWRHRKTLEIPQSVNSYLYVSIRRIILRVNQRQKARNRRNSEFFDQNSDPISSIEEDIIAREEKKERWEYYQEALKSLTDRQREALFLRVESGLSNQEIADVMNISDKRVRNLMYEGIKRLKSMAYKLNN